MDVGAIVNAAHAQSVAFVAQYVMQEIGPEEIGRKGTLGLVVRNVTFGWAGPENIRRLITTNAVSASTAHSRDEVHFLGIAGALETGQLTEGTGELYQASSDEYPLPPLSQKTRNYPPR